MAWLVGVRYEKAEANGVAFNVISSPFAGKDDVKIPGTRWALSASTRMDDVYKAAGLKTYDFSLPQPWWDSYCREHGVAPRGVWCYDSNLFGEFVSFEDALKRMASVLRIK